MQLVKWGSPSARMEPPKKARTMVHVAHKKAKFWSEGAPPQPPVGVSFDNREKITPDGPSHTDKDHARRGKENGPTRPKNQRGLRTLTPQSERYPSTQKERKSPR